MCLILQIDLHCIKNKKDKNGRMERVKHRR